MKDYYQILGVPENCSEADAKKAFRKLAFQCHPDKNPGREKESEAEFKEINEAYGVLGDSTKRQQYDFARKGNVAGAGYPGFQYSQQDIFNGIFSNPATFNELNRMFGQAGLRFDQDFLNRTFFSGGGFTFRVFTGQGMNTGPFTGQDITQASPYQSVYQPGWLERMLLRMGKFLLRKLAGLPREAVSGRDLDHHVDLEVSPAEAAAGGEKRVSYQRNGQVKNLVVKVPPGVKAGTKIRLRGMGMTAGEKSGDLYLLVRITG